MSRLRRGVVGPVLVAVAAAGLVLLSGQAPAQQPGGKGFEKKKGFEGKKDFQGKKEFGKDERGNPTPTFQKKEGPRPGGAEAVQALEAELQKLRAVEAELQERLQQLRREQGSRQPNPPGMQPGGRGPDSRGPDSRGPDNRGPETRGPGGFGPPGGMTGRGPGGPRGPGMPGGFGTGGPGGPGGARGGPMGGFGPPDAVFERMGPDQLREMIGRLQRILEEKTRGQAPQPRTVERGREVRPEGRQGPANEDIMRRLDQLSRELDEIRRAIRR